MTQANPEEGLLLLGLDGSNPLGFLAALGVLQTLDSSELTTTATMSWNNCGGVWSPVIHGIGLDSKTMATKIAQHLDCPFQPDESVDRKRECSQKRFDEAKSILKTARDELKGQGLRGKEREKAEADQLTVPRSRLERRRSIWLERLRRCVPSAELSLGKHLNAKREELREINLREIDRAPRHSREVVDLLASFGSDACMQDKKDQMESTPFCFITGSGHQYFLDTIRQLVACLKEDHFKELLFQQGAASDEKLSMRWDPVEDRRYALMRCNPTASGNKAVTNWAANLLAYRGLQMLPSVPTNHGLRTTGWSHGRNQAWTWPIWQGELSRHVIRSLLSHIPQEHEEVDRENLKFTGIVGLFRSRRLQVGNPPLHKVNFAPAEQIL